MEEIRTAIIAVTIMMILATGAFLVVVTIATGHKPFAQLPCHLKADEPKLYERTIP